PRTKPWSGDSKTSVATMAAGDFRGNEKSVTLEEATTVRIEHVAADGSVTVLRESLPLKAGEVLDTTAMSRRQLVEFLARQVEEARSQGVLFSLHLKATMMKVSDPIIFGHAVRVFFREVFEKHSAVLERLAVNPNDGFVYLVRKIAMLPAGEQAAIEDDIRAVYERGPAIAMVNSDKGITKLHVPSDIIIDASMPPMIRDGGKMWNAAGKLEDTLAV